MDLEVWLCSFHHGNINKHPRTHHIGSYLWANQGKMQCKFKRALVNCWDPILKLTIHPVKSKTDIPLYNLANARILYNQLCFELDAYSFEGDRIQLLNGFKFGFFFSLHYAGPIIYR